MMIRKLIVGFALGLTLVAGVSGTAEAKSKAVTVTVNKADSATAKKVDTAMKKGKAVTLKVKGSKKSSKKLLIELQDAVAKVNVYGARFDLDNGSESCQGKGNVFQTYADLSYKQSGGYGCYTFDKSTCNAYKYFLKSVDKQYKKRVANKDWKKLYKDYLDRKSSNENEDMRYERPAKVEAEFTALANEYIEREGLDSNAYAEKRSEVLGILPYLIINGEVTKNSQDTLSFYASCDIGNGHFGYDLVDYLMSQADSVLEKVNKELEESVVGKNEYYQNRSFEEYVAWCVGQNLADLYFGKITYLDPRYIGNTRVYGAINMKYDRKGLENGTLDWHLALGTEEYRMRQLYKGTKGVCSDFARVERTCMDYCGIKSYCVANVKVDHEICLVSGVEFNLSDEKIITFENGDREVLSEKEYRKIWDNWGWDKLIKKVMGSDYPF